MREEEYWRLLRMESSPWTKARRELFLSLLEGENLSGGEVLDVGCGMGGNMEFLERYGYRVRGIDKHKKAVWFCRERGLKVQVGLAEKIPFKDNSFDIIVASDLLEHLPCPVEAIKEFFRVLKPGGVLLVSVPAFSFLWSGLDDSAQHIKRYTMSLLIGEVGKKFKPVRLSYIFFSAFFPMLFLRCFRRLFRERDRKRLRDEFPYKPEIFNILILFLFRIENVVLRWFNFPLGVMIVGLFRKDRPPKPSV